MCGIHAVVSSGTIPPINSSLTRCLCNRGPDYLGDADVRLDTLNLRFTSTVLSLRGDHVTKQPFVDTVSGSVLCWNGEAWRIGDHPVQGNDGESIFRLLTDRVASSSRDREAVVLDIFRSIEGPFAFVYFDKAARILVFGRDRLGRRSLIIHQDETNGSVAISSVAEACIPGWKEVEADGIYILRLADGLSNNVAPGRRPQITRLEWLPDHASDSVSSIGRFCTLLPPENTVLTRESPTVNLLRSRLLESLRFRVLNIPRPPSIGTEYDTRVAVLFSGGLDCTVLARLTHDLLEADQGIDLLNVAFENPRVVAQLEKQANGVALDIYEACPDRITGRRSFAELQRACPGRKLRFIAVNVPYMETKAHRDQIISLIHPHDTEMDLSIAYALYFASRGQGLQTEDANPCCLPEPYTTPARALLSGLGADELFGGYGRHPSAFEKQGYTGLIEELKLDVSRLGKRNLGRDDRAMAHWGKEIRFPYLDDQLVKWAIETLVWQKCDFANGDEVSGVEPGKRVLRLLALELGMEGVAKEKKRAIQFGSRTAKMENGRVKGTTLISRDTKASLSSLAVMIPSDTS